MDLIQRKSIETIKVLNAQKQQLESQVGQLNNR